MEQETLTISQIISEALNGNYKNLEEVIQSLNKERENLVLVANQKIANLAGQIQILTSILEQSRSKDGLG